MKTLRLATRPEDEFLRKLAVGLDESFIAEGKAVDRLIDLIKEHNKWVEPA
jgi:hypothetical protein